MSAAQPHQAQAQESVGAAALYGSHAFQPHPGQHGPAPAMMMHAAQAGFPPQPQMQGLSPEARMQLAQQQHPQHHFAHAPAGGTALAAQPPALCAAAGGCSSAHGACFTSGLQPMDFSSQPALGQPQHGMHYAQLAHQHMATPPQLHMAARPALVYATVQNYQQPGSYPPLAHGSRSACAPNTQPHLPSPQMTPQMTQLAQQQLAQQQRQQQQQRTSDVSARVVAQQMQAAQPPSLGPAAHQQVQAVVQQMAGTVLPPGRAMHHALLAPAAVDGRHAVNACCAASAAAGGGGALAGAGAGSAVVGAAAPAKKPRQRRTDGEPRKRAKKEPVAPVMAEDGVTPVYPCPQCGKRFDSRAALSGHTRFCSGGTWRCEWCECKESDTPSRAMGPSGAKTLCNACGSRFRAGHTSMPEKTEDGQFLCGDCKRAFSTIGALGGHKRFCDAGTWRCGWCACKHSECSGKGPGPDGPKTLCSACSSRYKNGSTGPPEISESGKFVCEACQRQFDSIGALGGHKRFCDGGTWRCGWCEVLATECSGKGPGPNGPKTLCSACSARFRAGHTAPPLRDADGNFLCDSCHRAFVSMGALGGHRRFCGQLSTAVSRAPTLVDDSLLTDEDGGAATIALPDRLASSLPAELHCALFCAFDFATYFFRAIVPAATVLEVRANMAKRREGEDGLPPPPPPAEMVPFDPAKHTGGGAAAGAGRKKRRKDEVEDLSAGPRQMLATIQASGWAEWEAVHLLQPGDEPTPLLHAMHILSTHFLLVDLLEPHKISAGPDFCARVGEASRRLLGGVTLCPFTWPELLRMVLLARAVGQAPKKRTVALNAMLASGHGSASVAYGAAAALGGGHTVSVWNAGPSTRAAQRAVAGDDEEGADDEDGDVMGLGDLSEPGAEWAGVVTSLEGVVEYSHLSQEARCLVTECIVQLLSETTLCSKFFESTAKVHDKLQDLKRTEYKNRNAQIEAEEQAKLAAKYNIDRPLRLSHDRAGARESIPKIRGSSSKESVAAALMAEAEQSKDDVDAAAAAAAVAALAPGEGEAAGAQGARRSREEGVATMAEVIAVGDVPLQREPPEEEEEEEESGRRSGAEGMAGGGAPSAPPSPPGDEEMPPPGAGGVCRSCNNSGIDLFGNPCVCAFGRTARAAGGAAAGSAAASADVEMWEPEMADSGQGGQRTLEVEAQGGAAASSAPPLSATDSPEGKAAAGVAAAPPPVSAGPSGVTDGTDADTVGGETLDIGSTPPQEASSRPASFGSGGGPSFGAEELKDPPWTGMDADGVFHTQGSVVPPRRAASNGGAPLSPEELAAREAERRRKKKKKKKPADESRDDANHVKRGDLDQMRIRKDELRKQLDDDFTVLAGRVGRTRQEPIGLDRSRREYFILGGPAEGQQPGADLRRLLVRERQPRGPDGRDVGPARWWAITSIEEVDALVASLRPRGGREYRLQRALISLRPRLEAAMAPAHDKAAAPAEAAAAAPARDESGEAREEGARPANADTDAEGAKGGADEDGGGAGGGSGDGSGGGGSGGGGMSSLMAGMLARANGEEDGEEEGGEEEGEEGAGEGEAEAEVRHWLPSEWRSFASQYLIKHQRANHCRAEPQSCLDELRYEMLDLYCATPLPNARKQTEGLAGWTREVKAASTVHDLSLLLLQFARQIPRACFKKSTFNKPVWWPFEGDDDDDKEKKPPVKAKEKSEEPPPRIESAHQVLLRLHLLDAALLYSKGS